MPFMQGIVPKRIVIYAKDIENITGRSERTARKLLQQIRVKYNKQKGEFVTVKEFCSFTGLEEEEVKQFLLY
jgi:hypothetical protein